MALVTKKIAERENGLAYVEVDYQDTNELVQAVRWRNDLAYAVHATITRTDTGQQVFDGWIAPGTGGSAAFSGGNRFKLEAYSLSL